MSPSKEQAPRQGDESSANRKSVADVLAKCLPPPTDGRPVLLCIAGPNGAGKSTLFKLLGTELPFINADEMQKLLPPVQKRDQLAQKVTDVVRLHYVEQTASFATETVFSDPHGAKLSMLKEAADLGYCVVLVYVALPSHTFSAARVITRVANGGHTVPLEKLERRYHASLSNCKEALKTVEHCVVLENNHDLADDPFVPMATTTSGQLQWAHPEIPQYLRTILPHQEPAEKKPKKKK